MISIYRHNDPRKRACDDGNTMNGHIVPRNSSRLHGCKMKTAYKFHPQLSLSLSLIRQSLHGLFTDRPHLTPVVARDDKITEPLASPSNLSHAEELPLKAVKAMDATLLLSGSTAELETELACIELSRKILHRRGTDVLHTVADALDEVWDVTVYRALVLDGARHALRHFDGAGGAKIPVVGALLHGIDGAHPTIPL